MRAHRALGEVQAFAHLAFGETVDLGERDHLAAAGRQLADGVQQKFELLAGLHRGDDVVAFCYDVQRLEFRDRVGLRDLRMPGAIEDRVARDGEERAPRRLDRRRVGLVVALPELDDRFLSDVVHFRQPRETGPQPAPERRAMRLHLFLVPAVRVRRGHGRWVRRIHRAKRSLGRDDDDAKDFLAKKDEAAVSVWQAQNVYSVAGGRVKSKSRRDEESIAAKIITRAEGSTCSGAMTVAGSGSGLDS